MAKDTQKETNDHELSLMVKELIDGTTLELKDMIPTIDLSPEIPDAQIKQAVLDISPPGMRKLFAQFGRDKVLSFISEFSEGRKF